MSRTRRALGVLVARDGTLAVAVAGAVMAQLPERPLRVLVGGVQQYFRIVVLGGNAAATPSMPVANPATPAAPAAPKKRSAGC